MVWGNELKGFTANLVTECNFRDIPQARDEDDLMRSEAWYYVNKNDLFPEEFIKFLAMDDELRSLFLEVHGDLLTANYWREIKRNHAIGEISLVVPYYRPSIPSKHAYKSLPT